MEKEKREKQRRDKQDHGKHQKVIIQGNCKGEKNSTQHQCDDHFQNGFTWEETDTKTKLIQLGGVHFLHPLKGLQVSVVHQRTGV
jgi:hypothetical protein